MGGAPGASGPSVELPSVELPSVELPSVELPSVELPSVELTVNGVLYRGEIDPRTTLLDLLRDHLGLTGSKKGCDHGQCGACTVLVAGRRMNSCLLLAVAQGGREVTTVEGLASGDSLHPVQQAFLDEDAYQCGYCTPGQICSAVAMLDELEEGWPSSGDSDPDRSSPSDLRERMSGNLCRCGAYVHIIAAIQKVLDR